MSIEALKLIPEQDFFDETAFDEQIIKKHHIQEYPEVTGTMRTILKLINPVRVNGASDHEITTLFRDIVFKNRNTIGTSSIDTMAGAGLSDNSGTLTESGLKLFKAIATNYKGVEGELAY